MGDPTVVSETSGAIGAAVEGGAEEGRIAKRAGITLAGSVVRGALNFGNEALIARWVGPGVYGLYALSLGLIRIAEVTSLFGLRVGTLHFLPIHRSRGDRARVAGTVVASLVLPTALGTVLAALLWWFAPVLVSWAFDAPGAEVFLRWFALSLPIMAFSWMAGVVTWGFGYAHYFVIIKNLVTPVSFLAALGVVVLTDVRPVWVCGAFFASHLAASVVGVYVLIRVSGPVFRVSRARLSTGQLARYSAPLFVNSLLFMALRWTDALMLGALTNPEQVGIYRACILPLLVLEMVPHALNAATSSVFPVLFSEGRSEEFARAYASAIRWTAAASLAVWLVFFVGRNGLLTLIGPGFHSGSATLAILVSAQLLNNMTSPAGFVLSVTGYQRYETFNALLALLASLFLNFVLIPRYGLSGAAVATSAALVLLNTLRVVEVRSKMRVPAVQLAALRMLGVAGLLAGAFYVIGVQGDDLPGIGDPLALAAMLVAGLIGVAPAIWFLGLDGGDRAALTRLARRLTGRG